MPFDGVLVIDKPAGPTSHDVVARARRVLGETRIGHTGTLDPLATGVLPLVIGRATRLSSLLTSTDKEYEAAVRLGAATDTYDAAERLSAGGAPPDAPPVEVAAIEAALSGFRGTFPQMPPPYSAKKVGGVRAYTLARKQQPTELSAVQVTVHALDLLDVTAGLVRLRVVASPGFYVRSLAHDLGARLGCGAHLETLRRTRAGRFCLDHAMPLEGFEPASPGILRNLIPLEALVPDLPAVHLNGRGTKRASHGNFLSQEHLSDPGSVSELAGEAARSPRGSVRVRLFDEDGRLLAIAETGPNGVLRPSIVLV